MFLGAAPFLFSVQLAAAGDTRLVEAAKRADRAVVRALLRRGVDVNAPEPDGTTALHHAVHADDLEMARLLLRAGASVKATNRYGVAPLTLAAINGSARMIEALFEAGADANSMLPEGETVLMTAARTGRLDAVDALLARGADVNAVERWQRQTALMWAAAERHAPLVSRLIARGADLGLRSRGGLTALLFAVRAGDLESVRALVKAGASPSDATPDGTTALMLSIINVHFDVAAFLLERGANPNAPDPRGSALHALAFIRRRGFPNSPPPTPTGTVDSLDLIRQLLQRGANPNVRISWKEGPFDRDLGTVRGPQNIGIGRNYMSFVGATPFYLAARSGDVALMRLLVEHGADPKLPTLQNVTPLMAAAGLGFWDGESPGSESDALEAVRLAHELGNDVNAVADFGDTPSETDGRALLGRHFLKLDNAVGDMRWSGSTALHGAALRGANSIVRFLVEKGARLDARNKIGWTPLAVAEGVFVANTFKTQSDTAALIRELLRTRAQ